MTLRSRVLDLATEASLLAMRGGDPGEVWDRMTGEERVGFDLLLVWAGHPLAWHAGPARERWAAHAERTAELENRRRATLPEVTR